MSKKRKDEKLLDQKGISRRDFFKKGAAAGVGAVALAGLSKGAAQATQLGVQWDYVVDVIVVGSGGAALPAAIRARDLGSTVLVVEQSFDVGGKALHSTAHVSIGGGDPVQLRDLAGESDPEGFLAAMPNVVENAAMDDNTELAFRDKTDWAVLDEAGMNRYRWNDPAMVRAWAENGPATRQLLLDNYVRFSRIFSTHRGGGVSRARGAHAYLRLGDVTDIKAGTVTREDAGQSNVRASHFSPEPMGNRTSTAGEGTVGNGAALQRPLEFSAREKGIEFMLNRHMDELIREEPLAGRILGIRASYTPVFNPDTGEQIQSYWQNGNIDERRQTVSIRARKAVILACGGHESNPLFRSMFWPALGDPFYPSASSADLGGQGRAGDASGIIAGIRIGAHLAGMHQGPTDWKPSNRLGVREETGMAPGHPAFPIRDAVGLNVGGNGFQHLIIVDQVGRRYFNEIVTGQRYVGPAWPGGENTGTPVWQDYKPGDWRNSRPEWVRQVFTRHDHGAAILAINEGSQAPNYYPGPKWAIFDQAAVERAGWNVEPPIISYRNGLFFKADSLEELAEMVSNSPHSTAFMAHLVDEVTKWNATVDAGVDVEFERPATAMHKIGTPPFYAAARIHNMHDSNGGLRVNGKMQVLDMSRGDVIPGLYAAGETSGGDIQHGLGRATVQGFIAGTNAAAV